VRPLRIRAIFLLICWIATLFRVSVEYCSIGRWICFHYIADASARWSFLSDALIRAYNDNATDATIKSPISNTSTNNKIAGFVDDTTTLMIKHFTMAAFIILFLRHDAKLWECLLHTTGGKLEIPKCNFAVFNWYFDNQGRAILKPSNQQSIHVKCSESNITMLVPQIQPSKTYKYVGVHIALDGNMTEQIQKLQDKCNTINGALAQVYMSPPRCKTGIHNSIHPIHTLCTPNYYQYSINQNVLQ
jgi:hypothetical protein